MILQFKHLYTHFSFLTLPYACNGTGARHLPYSTGLDFYYKCHFASVFLLFVAYTHFSSFLALPYALCDSIKLYTSVESLECQELAISCCRAFGGSSVNHHTCELCGGVNGCNCISICWYSLARRNKFVVYIISNLLP